MTATEQNQKNMRTLLMFCAATLAVIGVITALFVGNLRQSRRESIVLPDSGAQSQQPGEQMDPPQQPQLLRVSRENVQRMVATLHRPAYYRQSYTITRQMNGAGFETTAEIWVSDARVCAVLQTGASVKHILTDGQTVYLWYEGDSAARQLSVREDMTMDALIGVPTYEQLAALAPETITDGEFITDDRYESGQQIFAAAEADGVRREYWIGLSSGLLTEAIIKSGDQTIYDAVQTELELLAAGDEAFERVFVLPDGTSPFSE